MIDLDFLINQRIIDAQILDHDGVSEYLLFMEDGTIMRFGGFYQVEEDDERNLPADLIGKGYL